MEKICLNSNLSEREAKVVTDLLRSTYVANPNNPNYPFFLTGLDEHFGPSWSYKMTNNENEKPTGHYDKYMMCAPSPTGTRKVLFWQSRKSDNSNTSMRSIKSTLAQEEEKIICESLEKTR
ncbi:hypothetical protein Ciccas_011294, partial [Cichlidogyrus casuarinus]